MGYKDPSKQREYQRAWHAKRRAKFFADKSCLHCGNVEELELDHIDPKQKVHHNIWSWSVSRQEEEIAKCQVLCRGCHDKKTALNMEYAYGTRAPSVKLSEEDVRFILSSDLSNVELANMFGVDGSNVRQIRSGKIWKHLQQDDGAVPERTNGTTC